MLHYFLKIKGICSRKITNSYCRCNRHDGAGIWSPAAYGLPEKRENRSHYYHKNLLQFLLISAHDKDISNCVTR